MWMLVRFELIKMGKRVSAAAAFAGILLYIAIMAVGFVTGESRVDEHGADVTGFAAISLAKEHTGRWEGELTAEKLAAVIENSRRTYADSANLSAELQELTNEAYGRHIQPNREIEALLIRTYSPPGTYDYRMMRALEASDAGQFYEQHREKVRAILDMDYTYGSFSEQEKAFWLDRYGQISVPFQFAYSDGWERLLRGLFTVILVIAFAVCISVAPVFASEYQSGMDAIVLTTRHGKGKAITAKIAASFLAATLLYALSISLYTAVMLICYGMTGWDASLQMILLTAPHDLTLLETYLLGVGLGYAIVLAIMSITLALSSSLKTSFATIITGALLLFVPLFLPSSKSSALWNEGLALLPAKAMDTLQVHGVYEVYPVFGGLYTLPVMIGIVYLAAVWCPLPLARIAFRRHQVH
ncbi:ABC transporter permease [Paenibacillus senegalensis]|uniref:ABC transporter permease n=1 Tax=Paenibacillus senegalensis TaxID=1465766 RepID=UPI0002897263|nr:ABC transporter permease [Paenibacillus senegalensis]